MIVFGGANCEGEMGVQMIRSFPWIDYVCCGEADHSFVALVEQLRGAGCRHGYVGCSAATMPARWNGPTRYRT